MAKGKAKGGIFGRVLAVFLVLLIIAAVVVWAIGSNGFKQNNPLKFFNGWGKGSASDGETNEPVLAVGADGEKLTDGSSYKMGRGLTLLTARSIDNNQEYAPDGEITLTATLSNEYINGEFDWAAKFADGKTAANYVSVTPDVTNTANATLRFLAPFSEQIKVTATLRETTSADVCTVDCLKSATISDPRAGFDDFSDNLDFEANASFGTGTITGDFELHGVSIYITNDFIYDFKNYLTFDVEVTNFGVSDKLTFNLNQFNFLSTNSGKQLSYSLVIKNFDNYDQAHKDAIYYAWFMAYKKNTYNTTATIVIDYKFQDIIVSSMVETDYIGIRLSGDCYGSEVSPSVTLNKNVVYGGK